MKRRCFVVGGGTWARIYVLLEHEGTARPRWARLQAMRDENASREAVRGGRAGGAGAGADPAGDEHRRFAGSVIQAAGAAMRATSAEELVLVAPPLVLAGLREYERLLARHGIATATVPMAIELLVPGTDERLLGGAVTRSFSFASATEALTQAA